MEFAAAHRSQLASPQKFGVLLSGPSGVGKSAVGLQAFLTCAAQNMPVVYISTAAAWRASASVGAGDSFFLELLLRQNADLIAAHPVLRNVLAPALCARDRPPECTHSMLCTCPLTPSLKIELVRVLGLAGNVSIGVIVDEAQHITKAVVDGRLPGASESERRLAAYFASWHNWDNENSVFVRMDIASCHGERELRMPSGESHRLRLVKPWTTPTISAALSMPGSPLFVSEPFRRRLAFVAGGIARSLFEGERIFAETVTSKDDGAAMQAAEMHLRQDMARCCAEWFAQLDPSRKSAALAYLLPLLRGTLAWDPIKGLYDRGVVALVGDGPGSIVVPVSDVAASVIIKQLGTCLRPSFRPLSEIDNMDKRGHELERQTIACIASDANWVDTVSFAGVAAGSVVLHVDDVYRFDIIAGTASKPAAVLSAVGGAGAGAATGVFAPAGAVVGDAAMGGAGAGAFPAQPSGSDHAASIAAAAAVAATDAAEAFAGDDDVADDGDIADDDGNSAGTSLNPAIDAARALAAVAATSNTISRGVAEEPSGATLYIPINPRYPCDIIRVPAASALDEPVTLLENSVTDPRCPKRVAKVLGWVAPGGVIEQLLTLFPHRRLVCLLCCPQLLASSNHSTFKKLEAAALAVCRVYGCCDKLTFRVVDASGLRKLGVVI